METGTFQISAPSPVAVSDNTDCNDQDGNLNQDDADSDGYSTCAADCNDNISTINPGGTEICDAANNDEDCDGGSDDNDPEGPVSGGSLLHRCRHRRLWMRHVYRLESL